MERLRREVAAVMGESAVATREQIRKMPFLACVVKESELFCHNSGQLHIRRMLTELHTRPSPLPSCAPQQP